MTTLPGATGDISRVAFDFGVAFLTASGGELRIETTFTLVSAGRAVEVDPERAGQHAAALVGLLGCSIQTVECGVDGSLNVVLGDGSAIQVRPDDRFEAWTWAGPDGEKVVALPGGGVSTWGAS